MNHNEKLPDILTLNFKLTSRGKEREREKKEKEREKERERERKGGKNEQHARLYSEPKFCLARALNMLIVLSSLTRWARKRTSLSALLAYFFSPSSLSFVRWGFFFQRYVVGKRP
jgi:hypothetical protein